MRSEAYKPPITPSEHDDTVRRSFRRQTGLFERDDSPFARRPDSPNAWLEPLDLSLALLDVACGAAHAAEQVAPSAGLVVGVDLTPELLAIWARRVRDAGIANVVLQEGAATALPFVDESFDVVFCRSALHHFDDPGALPLAGIVTEVADLPAVTAAFEDKLDGGPETGFAPERAEDGLMVSFVSVVVHATRA